MTDQNLPPVGPPAPPTTPATPPPAGAAPAAYAPPVAARSNRKLVITLVIVGVVVVIVALVAAILTFSLLSNIGKPAGVTPPSAGGGTTETTDTVTYTSSEFGYTAEFLGEPQEQEASQTVAGQEIKQIQAAWASGDKYMSTATNTFPEGLLEQAGEIDVVLENSVNGMVAAIPGAKLIDSRDSTLDGEQSVEGSVDVGNGQTMLFVISIHDGVQYLLLSSGIEDAQHTAFVDSFTFGS